jgi:hypothetical protein
VPGLAWPRSGTAGTASIATFALFRRDRYGSVPKPDPSLYGGTRSWAEALSTMRLMTGKRADTLLELMYPIEHFTLARA